MTCTDAILINNKCTFYGNNGLCKMPKRVYCVEYDGPNKKGPINSMSATGIDSYRNCHMKWLNQTYKRINVPDKSPALAVGGVGHTALAEYYLNGIVDLNLIDPVLRGVNMRNTDDERKKVLAINLGALLENYFMFYPQGEFSGCEVEKEIPLVTNPLPHFSLHGYVDLWLPDKKTVVEHKFLDSLETAPLAYKTQKVVYFLATGADHIIMNILRKPATRPKRNESLSDYKARVADDISSRRQEFFRRIIINRSQFDLAAEAEKIENLMTEVNSRLANELFDENPSCCSFIPCGYEPMCMTGDVSDAFQVEDIKRTTVLNMVDND